MNLKAPPLSLAAPVLGQAIAFERLPVSFQCITRLKKGYPLGGCRLRVTALHKPSEEPMKVLVAVKRVIDYNVKIR
ncbi:hypothetical protein, partial [Halomonas sp. SBBP1]|uniref:hypothetical protein n=1 Tax=Halomonas sp. SBBP1 TaxID=2599306 RepID=UPI001CF5443D